MQSGMLVGHSVFGRGALLAVTAHGIADIRIVKSIRAFSITQSHVLCTVVFGRMVYTDDLGERLNCRFCWAAPQIRNCPARMTCSRPNQIWKSRPTQSIWVWESQFAPVCAP
jgi:hypothetical protein